MEFYKKNWKEFSNTRHSIWKSVADFSKEIYPDSKILDVGCGNGKNMEYIRNKLIKSSNIEGIDNCLQFVNHCRLKGLSVYYGDIRNLPQKDNRYDFVICIAVIHHLNTNKHRKYAVQELLRVLKPNGKLLLTTWALESDQFSIKRKFKLGDNIVPFKNSQRYYYIYDKNTFSQFCNNFDTQNKRIFWDKGNWNVIFIK